MRSAACGAHAPPPAAVVFGPQPVLAGGSGVGGGATGGGSPTGGGSATGGGNATGGGTGTGGGSSGLALSAFCGQLADSQCARELRCGTVDSTNVGLCRAQVAASCSAG